MEPITITTNAGHHECLPFSQLPEATQEIVIAEHGDWDMDQDWWEYVYDRFAKDYANSYGIDVDVEKTCFSGFYSQGDGAAFTGELTDIDKFLAMFVDVSNSHKRVLRHMFNECDLRPTASPSTCSHYPNQTADFDRYHVNPHEDNPSQQDHYKRVEEALDWLEEQWEETCKDLASQLYSALEREYVYLTSLECLSDTFDVNDCLFDIETGELFYREEHAA